MDRFTFGKEPNNEYSSDPFKIQGNLQVGQVFTDDGTKTASNDEYRNSRNDNFELDPMNMPQTMLNDYDSPVLHSQNMSETQTSHDSSKVH